MSRRYRSRSPSPRPYHRPCGIENRIDLPHGGVTIIYLPLEQLDVHAEIVDGRYCSILSPVSCFLTSVPVSATVTLTQTFWQCSPKPTSQAKYIFPVPARAAVCGFEMRTEDGRIITAVAKEKETARREHVQAIRQGRLTGLVEHVKDDGQFCAT